MGGQLVVPVGQASYARYVRHALPLLPRGKVMGAVPREAACAA